MILLILTHRPQDIHELNAPIRSMHVSWIHQMHTQAAARHTLAAGFRALPSFDFIDGPGESSSNRSITSAALLLPLAAAHQIKHAVHSQTLTFVSFVISTTGARSEIRTFTLSLQATTDIVQNWHQSRITTCIHPDMCLVHVHASSFTQACIQLAAERQ